VFKHSFLDERKEKPRKIHKISITIIIIALILSAAPLIAGSPEKEKAAVISAEKWLTLVDKNDIRKAGRKLPSTSKMLLPRNNGSRQHRGLVNPSVR
jgi:hypothetical protein